MLVSIALTAATVCTARLHKTFRRDAIARDPRRDLLGRDRDILLRDQDETRDASVRDRLETKTSRPRPHPWWWLDLSIFIGFSKQSKT